MQKKNQSKSSRTHRNRQGSELPAGSDYSQNSTPCIVLKPLGDLHAMLVFRWSRLTPTESSFFIGRLENRKNTVKNPLGFCMILYVWL